MIVKKIPNPKATSSKAQRIAALTNYIRSPESESRQEKCLHAGARGFFMDDPKSQTAEMIALAQDVVRSRDPINHYVLSWRGGEQPAPMQVDDAVSIFLQELGWQDHQTVYGLHADTDNIHLHIAVNRVDAATRKIVTSNRGFDIEMAHRAVALIEQAQGWQCEKNARYLVLEDGTLARTLPDPDAPRQPDQKKRDMENRTGEKSALRVAIESGAPVIRAAQSWKHLHQELAGQGMRYEQSGGGAVVFVGDIAVKASAVDRTASLRKLQTRLGRFRPASQPVQEVSREPEPMQPVLPGWHDYIAGRRTFLAKKRAAKAALDGRLEQEKTALRARQAARRKSILGGDWLGGADWLNAVRSVLAVDQTAEVAALTDRHRTARAEYRQQFRSYPDFERWLRQQGHPGLAERWRHRASDPQRIEGDRFVAPEPCSIRGFVALSVGEAVHYCRSEGRDHVSIIDRGDVVLQCDFPDHRATLAALQLSEQKWGAFHVAGSEAYQSACVQLAARHRFDIRNPELQDALEIAWQQTRSVSKPALQSEQQAQFARYAKAVGADRYRVSRHRKLDGLDQVVLLGQNDFAAQGVPPQDLLQQMPDWRRMGQARDALSVTPLSEAKHHIVVYGLKDATLEQLTQDGFRPAVVLEVEPGRYQAVLTVQKQGGPHDKKVGTQLSKVLNAHYGDPALMEPHLSHLVPGLQNHSSAHQMNDRDAHTVQVRLAERQICGHALKLSRLISERFEQQSAERQAPQQAWDLVPRGASSPAIDAYWRHYGNLGDQQDNGRIDPSRKDARIALRMRVTGHQRSAIETAIQHCAPTIRSSVEARDWQDYAQRVARFACSPAGQHHTKTMTAHQRKWLKLEGISPPEPEVAPKLMPPGMAPMF